MNEFEKSIAAGLARERSDAWGSHDRRETLSYAQNGNNLANNIGTEQRRQQGELHSLRPTIVLPPVFGIGYNLVQRSAPSTVNPMAGGPIQQEMFFDPSTGFETGTQDDSYLFILFDRPLQKNMGYTGWMNAFPTHSTSLLMRWVVSPNKWDSTTLNWGNMPPDWDYTHFPHGPVENHDTAVLNSGPGGSNLTGWFGAPGAAKAGCTLQVLENTCYAQHGAIIQTSVSRNDVIGVRVGSENQEAAISSTDGVSGWTIYPQVI